MNHLEYFKSQLEKKAGKSTLGPNIKKLFEEIEANETYEVEKAIWVQKGQDLINNLSENTACFKEIILRRQDYEAGTSKFDPSGKITKVELSNALKYITQSNNKQLLIEFYTSPLDSNNTAFLPTTNLFQFFCLWFKSKERPLAAVEAALKTIIGTELRPSDMPYIPAFYKCLQLLPINLDRNRAISQLITRDPNLILENIKMLVKSRMKKLAYENRDKFVETIIKARNVEAWTLLYSLIHKRHKSEFLSCCLTALLRLPASAEVWASQIKNTQELYNIIQIEVAKVPPKKYSGQIDASALCIWGIKKEKECQGASTCEILSKMAIIGISANKMAEVGLETIPHRSLPNAIHYVALPDANISITAELIPTYESSNAQNLAAVILGCLRAGKRHAKEDNQNILTALIPELEKTNKFPTGEEAVLIFARVFYQKFNEEKEIDLLAQLYKLLPNNKKEIAAGFVNSQIQCSYEQNKPWDEITKAVLIGGIRNEGQYWAHAISAIMLGVFKHVDSIEDIDKVITHIKACTNAKETIDTLFKHITSYWTFGENQIAIYKLQALLASGANINYFVERDLGRYIGNEEMMVPAFWKFIDKTAIIKAHMPDLTLTAKRHTNHSADNTECHEIDIITYINSCTQALTVETIEYICSTNLNKVRLLEGVLLRSSIDAKPILQELILKNVAQEVIEDPKTMAAIYNSKAKGEYIEAAVLRLIRKGANPLKTYQGICVFTSKCNLEEARMKSIIDAYVAHICKSNNGTEAPMSGIIIEVELG